jgi:arabinofuranosyltransferase
MTGSFSTPRILFGIFCAAAFVIVFSRAWVTEDAYITFRVVDNFIHGYGLRWNIDERVQVYTHPLWMLLHLPFAFIFSNIYLISIGLSLVTGLAAVVVLCRVIPLSLIQQAFLIILPLTVSCTFNDFVICGLENPLSFLLLACLLREWFRNPPQFRYYRFLLLSSLLVLTRFDQLIIILPIVVWESWQRRRNIRLQELLLAISPLLLWCVFCLCYYGFILPNTKYAKLNTGIAEMELLRHGIHYIVQFFYYDFVGFLLIAGALFLGFCRKETFDRITRGQDVPRLKIRLLCAGMLLQVLYTMHIGGDMMAGRFMANMIIISIVILAHWLKDLEVRQLSWVPVGLLLAMGLHANILAPRMPYASFKGTPYKDVIISERAFYHNTNTLFPHFGDSFVNVRTEATHGWVKKGIQLRESGTADKVLLAKNIGMFGYYAGPEYTIIDILGLSDPLIARLPLIMPGRWRAGHYNRPVPKGYLEARKTGDTSLMDPDLAFYYEKLRLVTSGDMWDTERLATVIGFQLGLYDDHLNAFLEQRNSRAEND